MTDTVGPEAVRPGPNWFEVLVWADRYFQTEHFPSRVLCFWNTEHDETKGFSRTRCGTYFCFSAWNAIDLT